MRSVVIRIALGVAVATGLVAMPICRAEQATTFMFRGEVTHLTLEGGFWGIVAEDGRRFDPGQLPKAFQQAGRKVQVIARRTPDRISFRQWGQLIEIVEISDDLGH